MNKDYYYSTETADIKTYGQLRALETIYKVQNQAANELNAAIEDGVKFGDDEQDMVALYSVRDRAANHAAACRQTLTEYGYGTARFFASPAEAIAARNQAING